MTFTLEDAVDIGTEIGIDWDEVEFTHKAFLDGLEVELEHGTEFGEETNVTDDEALATGQIAWVHLMEDPDYYDLLEEMEADFDGERTEASTRRIVDSRRYAYVLDEIVEKHPEYISPEINQIAKDFIKKSEQSAKSLADNDEELIEYLEDAILAGPQLGNVSSGDLLELLMGNQVMGAIPLADLKAENLIRGDKIDVYDYLQAALQHLIERVAIMWLKGEQLGDQVKKNEQIIEKQRQQLEEEKQQQPAVNREENTVVDRKKQKGASAQRFATVRIHGREY